MQGPSRPPQGLKGPPRGLDPVRQPPSEEGPLGELAAGCRPLRGLGLSAPESPMGMRAVRPSQSCADQQDGCLAKWAQVPQAFWQESQFPSWKEGAAVIDQVNIQTSILMTSLIE